MLVGAECVYLPAAKMSRKCPPVQRLQQLATLMLVAVVLLTSAGWTTAEAFCQVHQGTAGTEAPVPPKEGKAPAQGCTCHLSAHLFAPVESPPPAPSLAHMDRTQPMVPVLHAIAMPDGLFRPPRLFQQA